MRRDDRDDPFDDLFREIERMMNDMMDDGDVGFESNAGFGADTHVDIHETDDEIRVIADIPGVDQDAIDLTCDGDVLTITAESERRQYDDKISLPGAVDEHSANATYNNGVLEVTFDRADDSANIDLD